VKIGLIIIGDELLSGSTQDCNMLYLGEKLRSLGLKLETCRVINDDCEVIQKTFNECLNLFDITICSGGLGPTIDDKTKMALANFLHTELEDNPEARALALKHYERRSLNWFPELNNYHMIPRGVSPYFNPKGLAPGLHLNRTESSSELLCAPGVPKEFQCMVDHFLSNHPKSQHHNERQYFSIRTAGIPEEQIFNKKAPTLWAALSQFGNVSSYPRMTGIDIVINDINLSKQKLKETLERLPELDPIREHIWHLGNGVIQEIVINFSIKNNITLSTAESCTGGLMAHFLTEVSGSSAAFWGSVVSYDNSVKKNLLNVSQSALSEHGAVSTEVAKQMASGVRAQMKTTYALSTSGVAGPLGATLDKPVGSVAIGIHGPNGVSAKLYHIPPIFDRDEMKKRFATRALVSLYKQMILDTSNN
jgi:nicotinamide-nucleotide amidase